MSKLCAVILNSYEFIVYAQVFAWVYAWAAGRLRATWRGLVPLAAAPVVGVGLHFLQVVWALGWAEAWADGLGISYVRGGISGLATRWEWTQKVPAFLLFESARLFFWPLHAVLLGAALWAIAGNRRSSETARKAGPLLAALVAATPTWFLAMPYAAVRNIYTIQQLVPLMVAIMGIAAAAAGRAVFSRGTTRAERCLGAVAGLLLIAGQIVTVWTSAPTHLDDVARLAQAIGPSALPPKAGVLSNAGQVQFAYYLRRPWWLVPNLERVPPIRFPDAIPMLQKHVPADQPIRYYLYASWRDPSAFELLAGTCPGRRLDLPWHDFLVLFDISALHLPPERRPALDPDIRSRQLRGDFPVWEIPGFHERLHRLFGDQMPNREWM